MKVFKLVDLYDTKYFYKSYVSDILYLCRSLQLIRENKEYQPNVGNEKLGDVYAAALMGESVVLDLADARLTSDACQALLTCQHNGQVFCDSKNEGRDHILKTNCARLNLVSGGWVQLPKFTFSTDLKEYISSLDSSVTYVAAGMDDKMLIAITCILTIIRPSLKVNVDAIAYKMFQYVATKVSRDELLNDTEFYFVTEYGIEEISDIENIYINFIDTVVPMITALQYGIIIPKKFGEKVLVRNKEWEHLFQSCLSILDDFKESSPKKLSELYGE